ncbi:GPI ethanolamine phosphate transferase 2, partial [Plakobranchus ocellatus]
MPPTVTLPRIKAMVTGSTSSFADVILNFGSSALEEDNIISQLKAHGQSIVFHGDDTWLKLFPNHFDRSSGTTSFFVSDYTEVDNNVTQHLQYELDNAMWDLMILHYLGLDHIGHFAGPRSPLIAPKLAEMDDIISQIYQAMESWEEPSLLIVCGDHGMSDQGGHGGATPSEISVPLIFLSPQITNAGSVPSNLMCSATGSSVAIQTTLAVMFVCLALHIVNSWPPRETLLQQFKALQSSYSCYSPVEILLLLGTVVHTFSLLSSSFVEEEHQTFYCLGTTVHLLILAQLVIKFAKGFRKTSSGQTVKTAAFGLDQEKDERFDDVSVMDMDKESDLYEDHNVNYCNDEGLQIALNTSANSSHSSSSQNETLGDEMAGSMIFRSDTLSHQQADMADGSCTNHEKGSVSEMSDVQADPQSGMSNMSFLHWAFSVLVVLLVLRVSRRLNHTGNKWLDIPDFGDWLVKPENKGYLSMLTVFSFMIIAASRGSRLKRVQSMCVNLALSCAYLSRAAQGTLLFPFKKILSSSGIMEAKASYLFITVTCLVSLVPKNFLKLETDVHRPAPPHPSHQPAIRHSNRQSQQCSSIDASTSKPKSSVKSKEAKSRASDAYDSRDEGVKSSVDSDNEDYFSIDKRLRGFMAAVVCFACLVKQPHNAPVVAVMSLTEQMMTPVLLQINLKPVCAMLYCVWMAHVFFFLQGNSNSLSTVDIAAAYVGLDSYWPEVNGMLMFAATYVSNIFWAVALLNILWITHKHLSS